METSASHASCSAPISRVGTDEVGRWVWATGGRAGVISALELWDAESWQLLAARQVQVARDTGASVQLQLSLSLLAWTHLLAGELPAAAQLIEEDHVIAEATRNAPAPYTEMLLAAWRGQEAQASELIEATRQAATAIGLGRLVDFATYASSVLYQRPRSARRRAGRRVASFRARSLGVRTQSRARAGRGRVQDR